MPDRSSALASASINHRGRRINIVYRNNGQGLTRDARLLAGILRQAGHTVTRSPVPPRLPDGWRFLPERCGGSIRTLGIDLSLAVRHHLPRGAWDLNLFLEGIDSRYLPLGRRNCLIPNQEWLTPEDHRLMGTLDLVLFKTRHAEALLGAASKHGVFIGFTSEERRLQRIATDWNAAIHVAGWNPLKGTAALVAEWPHHPEWPHLLAVVQTRPAPAANLRVVPQRVPDGALRMLQNRRGIQLCPSEMEGFGHSINEARSCGALIVTTDAPPMNELVTPESGLLVPFDQTTPMAFGTRFCFSRSGLQDTLERLMAMPAAMRASLGAAARAAYEAERTAFSIRLLAVVNEI